ncbi:ParA family protein [Vibrio mediterranei]
MNCAIETLKALENFSASAKKLLQQRNDDKPKLVRTFSQIDAKEYLKCDHRTIEKYANELGINPKAHAEFGIKWMLTLDEIYRIRDILPDTTILKKRLEPFSRKNGAKQQVIAFTNQKGGVGKTMSAISIATGMATEYHEQYSVLVIDMDGQSTLTTYQPSIDDEERPTIGELVQLDSMMDGYADIVSESVSDTTIPNLKILPAAQGDRDIETIFHEGVISGTIQNPYTRLRSVLDAVSDDYDLVVIDTPPSLGYASLNSYFASTGLILPLGANQNDTDATCQYLTYLPQVYKGLVAQGHKGYDFIKFVLTNYEETSTTSLEVKNELNSFFGGSLLPTAFKKSEAIRKCSLEKNTVYDLSKSMYDGHKNTFNKAKLNVDELLAEVMLEVRKVWNRQEKGNK